MHGESLTNDLHRKDAKERKARKEEKQYQFASRSFAFFASLR